MSSILLCISAGRGPAECREAVAHVTARLVAEAHELELDCATEANPRADKPSVLVSVSGNRSEDFVRGWEGSVQWTATSHLRQHHKRKNWFVAVHRLPEVPPVCALNPADLFFQTLRAGGPGGQHQNCTESAVRVVHRPTGVSAIARDERSQHRNRALAVERLACVLAGMQERERNARAFREWMLRINVERGNPVRILIP